MDSSTIKRSFHVNLNIGLGGVMMENTDWLGGLRDRQLIVEAERHCHIDAQVEAVISEAKKQGIPLRDSLSI